MKEIKFRAWLKKENRMIDPVIGLDLSNPYPTIQWFENEHDVLSNNVSDCFMDECELMQYTGLKDKNGKEIYEGDIVKGKTYLGNMEVFARFIGEVKYYAPKFELDGVNKYKKCREELNGSFEVIGNVYSNPERRSPHEKETA